MVKNEKIYADIAFIINASCLLYLLDYIILSYITTSASTSGQCAWATAIHNFHQSVGMRD